MRDVRQIVRFWRERETTVVVTLVGAEGSSYRLPGAQLLVGANGDRVGTISGGCLEATVVREATWKIREGAVVQRYSTAFDDMSEMPFGSGCGGVVELLMEPGGTVECEALMGAVEAALGGAEAVALTWLPVGGRGLMRAILGVDGDVLFRSAGLSDQALRAGREGAMNGDERLTGDVFVSRLRRPQRLFLLGAGDDAKPLSEVAALMGWTVTVMDGRSHLATRERFPGAQGVGVIASAEGLAGEIGADDAVVLMTHSFEQDKELLTAILPRRPKYLGLLGARRRSSLLMSEVAAALGVSVAECCEQVHAPIGLNLGGDGAESIALAIAAEIQACCTGTLPRSRKLSAVEVQRVADVMRRPVEGVVQCGLDVGA